MSSSSAMPRLRLDLLSSHGYENSFTDIEMLGFGYIRYGSTMDI